MQCSVAVAPVTLGIGEGSEGGANRRVVMCPAVLAGYATSRIRICALRPGGRASAETAGSIRPVLAAPGRRGRGRTIRPPVRVYVPAGRLLSWPAISQLPGRAAYPSRVAGDHYIQAALMGRWGEPPARSARERAIAVRMKQPAKTFQTTPENVGKENSL